MTKGTHATLFSQAYLRVSLVCVLAAFSGPLLRAQEIRIRVLNGNNGRPITDECLNVSLGRWHGGDLIAPTNNDGVVVLHFGNNEVTSDAVSPRACNGAAVAGPRPLSSDADSIAVASDYYVACQEYGKTIPGEPATPNILKEIMPSYPIKKILEAGVAAGNMCGKVRVRANPGELIFFVRPLHWWEGIRR